jgi:hypothetical protein
MDDLGQDGITAYHGSPHDFKQFDTSKIGTGEGAQSYGHGLYFAGHEPVAEGYRDRLGAHHETSGETMADQHVIEPHFYKNMNEDEIGENMNNAAQWAEQRIFDQGKMKYLYADGSMLIHDEDRVRAVQKQPGHMYEVHINAHPHHMLDWDKPLSEQPSHITKSLFDARKEMPTLWKKTQHHINNDSTAGDFYQSIAAGHPHGYAGATEQLSRAGIKGIKYLDAGSRGDKAKPTHNYVVFDHNDVHIKRKYEQGGAVDNDVIPHGDSKREQNLTAFQEGNHPDVPHVVYHATNKDFSKFFPMSHFGTLKAATDRLEELDKKNQNIIPVHISMKNPFHLGEESHTWRDNSDVLGEISDRLYHRGHKEEATHIQSLADDIMDNNPKDQTHHLMTTAKILQGLGYDGVTYVNKIEDAGSKSFIPLFSNQIKSATGNRGTFDPKNPDITKADGGDVMDDSRIRRSGEGGQETALDFIQNAPLYKQRMEDQKQPQPQAAPAPAPQTESKPMPVIAAPPPAIIRPAEETPPAQMQQVQQQQPQGQMQTGLFHIGTNDMNPKMTVQSAQRIIESAKAMGIDPMFLLPNQTARGNFNNPYNKGNDDYLRVANNSYALQKYLDDNGVKYVMPDYNNKVDGYHMDPKWVRTFAKSYNNPFIAGDSNAVLLNSAGYNRGPITETVKGKNDKDVKLIYVKDPNSSQKLSWGAQTSAIIADELAKHLRWYQQNAPQHRSDGGEVDRRQMHHKDVTERVPQLTEGANKLAQGEIDKHEYQRLVNQHKPVHPYESVPAPATHEEMYAALQENKRDKLGQAENIPEGHPVGLRLDIPAYKDHGVWVPTIHNQSDHKTIAHDSHAMVSDATFKIPQNKALKVATGTAKSPFATIDGNFNHISHEDAIQLAAHALNHPEWTQVGMDPERHGFFYDRRTQRPVKNAAKVLQVGPLVLAHHAELGNLSDPEYHYALGGNIGHREHFEDGGAEGGSEGGSEGGLGEGPSSGDMGGGGGGGGGNDNTPEPATPVDEEKPEEKAKPAPPMPLTPQNMGTNLGYDPIPSATFTPATPTALPPTTSFQQFAGGGLVDAALKKVSSKYTDTGLPLNAMEILSKIARTG